MDDPRNRTRYGNAHDLERMVKQHPGEQFWVHESDRAGTPLMFGLGDEPLEPGEHYDNTPFWEGVGDELGDKLAMALDNMPVSQTTRIGTISRRRQRWWRLLPGKHCRNCGARLHRTDPEGHPSRVWWCTEHGPFEQP